MSLTPHAKRKVRQLVYAAVCLALALVLPFLTGHIRAVGKMLLPMHLPVLLAGFVVGPWWAMAVGFLAPVLRHLLFAMPPYPSFVAMAFELAAYGLVSGLIYQHTPRKKWTIYVSLLSAMVVGRAVSGVTMAMLMGLSEDHYTFPAFIAANFTSGIPGIVLQIVLVPLLVMALEKANIARKHID